jgi:hypothetical protein
MTYTVQTVNRYEQNIKFTGKTDTELGWQSSLELARDAMMSQANAGNFQLAFVNCNEALRCTYRALQILNAAVVDLRYLFESFAPTLEPDAVMEAWLIKANEEAV